MILYILSTGFSPNTLERTELLEDACRQRDLCYRTIESGTVDRLALPSLVRGDALFNATRGGIRLEEFLWRPGVATFYLEGRPPLGIQDTTRWLAAHALAGLVQPKTIVHATADRKLLSGYVDFLGGFPIVVKVAELTLGMGVIRVDSWTSLISLADFLFSSGTDFILRQYIDGTGSVRLMVIGNRVVGALEYVNPPGDFRTNAGHDMQPQPITCAPKVEALAIAAVNLLGAELGGVDIMFDREGTAYLLNESASAALQPFRNSASMFPA